MHEDRYQDINISSGNYAFTFVSEGRHGNLVKIVKFKRFENSNTYNLSLGTILNDGSIDYKTISNNGDRNKLLATVAFIISQFLERYPGSSVYITGSDFRRTLLYHRVINYGYSALIQQFDIEGDLSDNDDESDFESFDPKKVYYAFLVQLK